MSHLRWVLLFGVCLAVSLAAVEGHSQEAVEAPDEAAVSLPVWETRVETERPLYWYGNRFDGPIELRLVGIELSINGQRVPLYDHPASPDNAALLAPPEERTLSPHEALNREADAEPTFEDFVSLYRASELVDSMFVINQSAVAVRWEDSKHPIFESLHYDPVPLVPPPLTDLVQEAVASVADHLDRGYAVWCNGIDQCWWTKREPLPDLPPWAAQYAQNPLPLTQSEDTEE